MKIPATTRQKNVPPACCDDDGRDDGERGEQGLGAVARDERHRRRYLDGVYGDVARLLGAVDRNPFHRTFGCLDRQYWHYRTACFPSEMYQEGVLPLALAWAHPLPGNRWYGSERVRELAVAAIRFSARSCHGDGSCDDYYPYERALGAAVFSLQAAAGAYQLLGLNDQELLDWFRRRARWVMKNEESGRLANHHALAALGLWRVAQITGQEEFRLAALRRIEQILAWQDEEGWFDEYGGADPGYQTVTIDCLARLRAATGNGRLDDPLRRAVVFASHFLHPDGSYGGEYGSRGTCHFYPHGFELLAGQLPEAADLADGFLRSVELGTLACFHDDRLFAHRLGNRIEAYLDWSPTRAAGVDPPRDFAVHYPRAGLFAFRRGNRHTVVSTARGGVVKHFDAERCTTDAGLVIETGDGTVCVSQMHEHDRKVDVRLESDGRVRIAVSGSLHAARFETATPLKQSLLHAGMWGVGRWCRTAVRRLLQRRLITGRRRLPIRLERIIELRPGVPAVQVTDKIELASPALRVRRLAIGTDHQAAYVAACGVYQDSVLEPWTDLAEHVEGLNRTRRAVVVRRL
ncbi:MAG: hypothetical protein ACYC6Y_00555 [Thermoguttaceae bacterium]